MSTSSLFYGNDRFSGDWSSGSTYNIGEIVKGSNNTAYRCKVAGTTGAGTNPISTPANWDVFVPFGAFSGLSGTQINRLSVATNFGINAGSTWQYKGDQWLLEKTGNAITLVRTYNNCNCNCNCNCTGINCNCAGNCNCNCSHCMCWYNCDCANYSNGELISNCNCFHYSDCSNCHCDCSGTDCNCASDCNCNCTPI